MPGLKHQPFRVDVKTPFSQSKNCWLFCVFPDCTLRSKYLFYICHFREAYSSWIFHCTFWSIWFLVLHRSFLISYRHILILIWRQFTFRVYEKVIEFVLRKWALVRFSFATFSIVTLLFDHRQAASSKKFTKFSSR